ncbi:MAG: thioredoxin domain-containing protein [Mariprofundaceae bacterium]|nr:thioredoxin domain-containing protein [Mariprofundaceae bacterium]
MKHSKYLFVLLCLCLPHTLNAASVSAMDTDTHTDADKTPANQLAGQASPYLLQHAHNPVNWYAWGAEAFAKAKREDKPILLSIGYSTCHWCHVMEEESFSDTEVGRVLNEYVVAIKVDREERPDIDQVYMQAAQMMGVHGGWPLNILMTPDKHPFFAATYLPKHSRFGRVGLIELVQQVGGIWRNDREKLLLPAKQLATAMTSMNGSEKEKQTDIPVDFAAQVFAQLRDGFDAQQGGFGDAPKFPSPHKLLFLLRYWQQKGEKNALDMVEKTLMAMRAGGIFDQLGYGFHRYSTDSEWLLPHFEKMLYDQAMLLIAYAEAYQATGKAEYAQTTRHIADYVLRMLQAPEGGFYSAEDADSEGEEGRFYMWRLDELNTILGAEDGAFAAKIFAVTADGNIRDEATGKQTGANVLHVAQPPGSEKDKSRLEHIRQRLFAAREKRIHPFRDDKILSDWNGLMIAALSIAARVLDEPVYAQHAEKAATFVLNTLHDKQGRLLHRYRGGKTGIAAHLDDYAFLVWGLIELYETGLEATHLATAIKLNEAMLQHFSAPNGGLYFTADDAESLPARPLDAYDGALPSGNSVAMMNLLRLARMSGDTALEKRAAGIASAFAADLPRAPTAFIWLAAAHMRATSPGFEIVLAGDRKSEQAAQMLKALRSRFLPGHVLLWANDAINRIAPYTKGQQAINGKVTAYVCENFQCNLPVMDSQDMLRLLDQSTADPSSKH